MKFVGLLGGDFKIVDDLKPEQLGELKADFAWIDIDNPDVRTEAALKEHYGIKEILDSPPPGITKSKSYDRIVLSYYVDMSPRKLQIFVSGSFIITAHRGDDPVCEEAMAALNEMLVSGKLNADSILGQLFITVVRRHAEHLRAIRGSLRSIDSQAKSGTSDVKPFFQLSRDSREMAHVFHATKDVMGDICLKATSIRGLKNPKELSPLYSKMDVLIEGANSFSESVDEYTTQILPFMWGQMSRVKSRALGVSIFSLFVAGAALVYLLSPEEVFGLEKLFLSLGTLAVGGLAFLILQRKTKFRSP